MVVESIRRTTLSGDGVGLKWEKAIVTLLERQAPPIHAQTSKKAVHPGAVRGRGMLDTCPVLPILLVE